MLQVLKWFFFLTGMAMRTATAQTVTVPTIDSLGRIYSFGALAEVYSYSQFAYNGMGIGGYFGAVTFRPFQATTLGIGYDYSLYNHSALGDIRIELGRTRIRPVLTGAVGYAFASNQRPIKSSWGFANVIAHKQDLVFRLGAGLRGYYWPKLPIALYAGVFYKVEPGYQWVESRTGGIVVTNYDNVGSLCFTIGIAY